MAKHRTKEQKIIARLRRRLQGEETLVKSPVERKPEREHYSPVWELPVSQIKADLRKTVVISGLMLGLQLALAQYLQRGGWNVIRSWLAW